ncbi:Gfo/Idh/MocA family oxidoreductase [Sinomonas sp. JGH33]|uniref:Gfo/Idh/MocA family oxidoreductase n=1 Tax=Sinomonas terricola TaxID=3110330 RepID=A0ABU5TB27_9MICC|nr:Gfo/Idh/MocA family oxidoreductase [Sinomonas sp. JGH33]MEA5456902.1 Gfo/Idh/MocA family oxidoreductase [Sinomonas sp. JGH33]
MVDDLKLGLIGYGLRARSLSKVAHRPGEGSRITAVFDIDPDAGGQAPGELGDGVAVHNSLAGLLDDRIDAVLVASPDHLHEEHATAALDAGLTVYLEKPMAVTVEGCDQILAAARQSEGRLYLGHNMRHMPFVQEMKRLIDSGAIGEPKLAWCRHFVGHGGDFYFRDWHAERRATTGLLLQKGAHDIDVLHWLMGGYSEEVTAMGDLMVYGANPRRPAGDPGVPWRLDEEPLSTWPPSKLTELNPVVDVEDASMVLMGLDNGTLASYQQCHFTPDYWRSYTIIGTEGRIENLGDVAEGTVVNLWNQRHYGYAPADRVFPVHPEPGGHGGADERIMREFIRYASSGGPIETSPLAARNAVAAACAATASVRDGGAPKRVAPATDQDLAFFQR